MGSQVYMGSCLLSKVHSLSPEGKCAPSVSLSTSPLNRKKQRDGRKDASQERGENERILVHCVSSALYAQLSLESPAGIIHL